MTEKFLDFTASKGNNLKDAGVKPGQKWCLCASRWQEAMKAVSEGQLEKEHVPKVHLHATHDKALDVVSYKDLKQYAAPSEAYNQSGRQEAHYNPEAGGKGVAKEHKDISKHGRPPQAPPPHHANVDFYPPDLSLAPGAGSHNKSTDVKGVSGQRG